MAQIPKGSGLNIDLNQVADPAVKNALAAIVDFANGLVADGLVTNGVIKAKAVQSIADEWSVSEEGVMSANAINLLGYGRFKVLVKMYQVLASGASQTWAVPPNHRVIGACGYTTLSGVVTQWAAMGNSALANQVSFSQSGAGTTYGKVKVVNGAGTSNHYNLIIFYTE